MKFSLDKSQHYVSYIRGKSNILQVFDTKNDSVVSSIDYSDVLTDQIRGLVPYGDELDNLKHLLVDLKGNVVLQDIGEDMKAKTRKSGGEIFFKALGEHVHCVTNNPNRKTDVAIGSKD